MRKKNLKNSIMLNITNLKANITSNKKFIFMGLGFAVLGLLIAFGNINIDENNLSLIGQLNLNCFSFFKFELKLIIYLVLFILIPIILSINYYLFLLSFVEISFCSYLIFSYIFNTIAVDAIWAIITALLIFIPIICILFINLIFFISNVYQIINYPLCKKFFYIVPLRNHFFQLKKFIINFLLYGIIPCLIWTNLIILIFYFIF